MDRLETAKRLIIAGLLFSAFALFAIFADSTIRAGWIDRRPDMRLKGANLPGPAFFPTGHPVRNPEGIHAAVDLRFSPGLPLHLKYPIYPATAAEELRGASPP